MREQVQALLDALDKGLVVFKLSTGEVVAGHPWNMEGECLADLRMTQKVWSIEDLASMRYGGTMVCSICKRPWQEHYKPDRLKYKAGPFGTYGLKDGDHTPHIHGVHAERKADGQHSR